MNAPIPIDDPADPRLDDYRDLRDRDLRGHAGRPGLFVAEAALPVENALAIPGIVRSVLMAPAWVSRIAPKVPAGIPMYVAPLPLLQAVSGYRFHRGVLAIGVRQGLEQRTLDEVLPRRPGPLTVLLCDAVNNIDNIGLLFRNAAAFAADAVVLGPGCCDPLYRKSVRVSIGHVLRLPWASSSDWEGDLQRLRGEWGLRLIGASASGDGMPLDKLERPQRVGLIVGQEYAGLSPASLACCDHLARIPMAPGVDSLNVAVAAAVCLHRLSGGVRI